MSLTNSIPASQFVNVIPSVLSAGGDALDVIALLLSTSVRVPIGTVSSFPDAETVRAYFGSGSVEATAASVYFGGFNGRTVSPDAILFAQYPAVAVAGYLRSASFAGVTLAQLQALTPGTLTTVFAGVSKTSAAINLSAATSFSNAATLIQAAFTTPNFTVAYDSVLSAFVFTGAATGVANTVVFGTGAFAALLKVTSATGAVISQGADIAVPGTFMDNIVDNVTQDWVTFMTTFDPDASGNTNKLAFAVWTNAQNNEFAYVCWDTDAAPANSVPAAGSLGALLAASDYSGTCLIWASLTTSVGYDKAAFICGTAASIDFTRLNGRITFKFKRQDGLTPDVTNALVSTNLASNGYNFYGAYATRNAQENCFANGVVSGQFEWFDSYINQIWLNNELQLGIFEGMLAVNSIPYNAQGYALVESFCMDAINAGLNFGAIRPGVTLSNAQVEEINIAAGATIANIIQTRGWYLQISDATAQVRAARGSPPCTLWYADGGSIQKIDLASIEVQ